MSLQATQHSTATSLVTSGLSLQLLGLLWGLLVQNAPFPRLALTAHIQLMVEGCMVLLIGLTLLQPHLLQLSNVQSTIVYWGLGPSVWVILSAEIVNAFWGTKEILPIAAKEAGAQGGLFWQEKLMTATHMVPSVPMIAAVAVLVSAAFAAARNQSQGQSKME